MNACVTLLMGLAAMGYQLAPGDFLPEPAPAVEEEVAPAPLPVEAPAVAPPAVPRPVPVAPLPERPSTAAPIDAFAPELAEPTPPMLGIPLEMPSVHGPTLVPQAMPFTPAMPFHGAIMQDGPAPFHVEPALMPIPMSTAHGGAVRNSVCHCTCEKPADSSCRSRCCLGKCCENSTCDMPPHMAYYPAHHGYYYFRPYNHTHIAEHQAIITAMGGDSRAPYSTADFARFYEGIQGMGYDQPAGEPLHRLPHLSRRLPSLESLLPSRPAHP